MISGCIVILKLEAVVLSKLSIDAAICALLDNGQSPVVSAAYIYAGAPVLHKAGFVTLVPTPKPYVIICCSKSNLVWLILHRYKIPI